MKTILTNAFSINMLSSNDKLMFKQLTLEEAQQRMSSGFESAVGHADTAALFSTLLNTTVPCNRTTVTMKPFTNLIVGQYTGPRLPEGATTLPEGADVQWWAVYSLMP